MPMLVPFALAVQRIDRQGITVDTIADELAASAADVMEAHHLILLPMNCSVGPGVERSAEQRQAESERMPKRMQDRIRRSRH